MRLFLMLFAMISITCTSYSNVVYKQLDVLLRGNDETPMSFYMSDVDNNGIDEFKLNHNKFGDWLQVEIYSFQYEGGKSEVSVNQGSPLLLEKSSLIDNKITNWNCTQNGSVNSALFFGAGWDSQTEKYVPLRFSQGENIFFGWISILIPNDKSCMKVVAMAYNNTAGEGLKAEAPSSVKTGQFNINLGSSGYASCYVPDSYSIDESYPLIAALPLGGGSPEEMRAMLLNAAIQSNSILICADNDYGAAGIDAAINYITDTYNIIEKDIVVCGYSLGGRISMIYSLNNMNNIKGYLGIAPALTSDDFMNNNFSSLKDIPTGFICGDVDDFLMSVEGVTNLIEGAGGTKTRTIVKQGVDHIDEYYSSAEFTTDFIELLNFIHGFSSIVSNQQKEKFQLSLLDNLITVTSNHTDGLISSISIYDLNGYCCLEKTFNNDVALLANEVRIDISNFASGLYFVKIVSESNNETYKIVVVK